MALLDGRREQTWQFVRIGARPTSSVLRISQVSDRRDSAGLSFIRDRRKQHVRCFAHRSTLAQRASTERLGPYPADRRTDRQDQSDAAGFRISTKWRLIRSSSRKTNRIQLELAQNLSAALTQLSQAQRERLAFMDMRAYFTGEPRACRHRSVLRHHAGRFFA